MALSTFPVLRGLTYTVTKTSEFDTIAPRSSSGASVRVANMINPLWHWELLYEILLDDSSNLQAAYTPSGSSVQLWPTQTYTDLKVLMGFFNSCLGQYAAFLFSDPDDNSVTYASQTMQLVNDGATIPNWYTPIQRAIAGIAYEDITDLNGAIAFQANANAVTAAPSSAPANYVQGGPGLGISGYSFGGLYITWMQWAAATALTTSSFLIDSAGHLQQVTATTGDRKTGSVYPTFNHALSTTTDNHVTWTDRGLAVITAQFSYYFRVRFETDKLDFEKFVDKMWTIGGSEGKNGSGSVRLMTERPVLA